MRQLSVAASGSFAECFCPGYVVDDSKEEAQKLLKRHGEILFDRYMEKLLDNPDNFVNSNVCYQCGGLKGSKAGLLMLMANALSVHDRSALHPLDMPVLPRFPRREMSTLPLRDQPVWTIQHKDTCVSRV